MITDARKNSTEIQARTAEIADRRAVVHVGLIKTGTTTIQTWLERNVSVLRTRDVVFDPLRNGGRGRPAHSPGFALLACHLSGHTPYNRYFDAKYGTGAPSRLKSVAKEFEARADESIRAMSKGTYVISAELLSAYLVSSRKIACLDTWLRSRFDSVDYVMYVRNPVDWVASYYAQVVRIGHAHDLDVVASRAAARDFCAIADLWAGTVGRDRLNLRLMVPDFLLRGDLIADFASILKTNAEGTERIRAMNASPSSWALSFLASFNHMSQTWPYPIAQITREVLLAIATMVPFGKQFSLPEEIIQMIIEKNNINNERLRRTYFPEREVLFPTGHGSKGARDR